MHRSTRRAYKRASWPTILLLASMAALCSPTMSATAAVPTVKLRGTSKVRDADNPARHAFHVQMTLTFGAASAQEFEHVDLSSQMGQIFVIEFVSSICFVPTGQKLTNITLFTGLAGDQFPAPSYFPPVYTGTFSGATDEFSASTLTRLYHLVQPNTDPISLQINRNSTAGVGHCDITLSGYLLDPNL